MAYPRIGVALSGGGAKGFAHVGVLKVLEEHRVPISAIAGTSIGSVIGGLYAAGYSAVQIEEELLKIDWKRIFRDIPNRSELLLEDKDRAERHFVTVPLKGKRIALPTGLYAGQSLLGLLGEFSWPVQGISDFSNYPIRFASLSADLETGQAFLIRGGNLHEAMRASMAIPTAFTPWKYEGRLLVDGLLVRNFPVEDVRALGSEVVIGVDVGAPLYQADEMDSLIKIFDQSISIPSADTNTQQLELCDFVISPEVDDLRRTDFARVRDFIDKGEQAARLLIPKILRRMKELGISEALPRPSMNKKKEFAISTLELEGLSNHRPDFVLSELRLKIPGNISYSDVKAAMERLYNTAFFETVTYRIDGNKLVFKLEEKTPAHLGLGVHYDTAERASLFLNVTARNLGFQNSRTSANLKLGQENQLSLESTFFSRLRPKWQSGFKVNFNYEEFNLQSRHRHLPQRNGNDYDLSALEIIYGSIRSRSFGLGVGLRGEILSREKQNTIRPLEMSQTKDAGWVVHLRRDTLDSFAYPTKGDYLDLKLFATERELSSDTDQNHFLGVWQKVQQLKRGLSLSLGAKLGRNNNGQGLAHRNFYLGGFESFLSPHGFVGLRYRGLYASNMAAWQAGLQFQVNPMTLISLRHNEATLDEVASRLNSGTRAIRGTGVALVKLTEIGPLEAGISHGSEENFYSWLSVGYRY